MKEKIYVWDPVVRLFHWTMVAAFTIAYFTGGDKTFFHQYTGYIIAALLIVRVIWGFVGTRHARFGDFVRPPRLAIDYLKSLATDTTKNYIGHNPAGGWMVVALLVSLSFTGATGLMVFGLKGHGPLASYMKTVAPTAYRETTQREKALLAADHDRAHAKKEPESGLEEVLGDAHDVLANITVFLIGLHLLGVVLSSYRHRQNLVRAMVTGYKEEES